MNRREITLVIHGTFAAGETWWRLGGELFADRLEEALVRYGLQGTVWRPALEAGLTYEDFMWSGRNVHCDRVEAGRALAGTLASLADRTGATSAEPLILHLVGHSHGGNVILEALRSLDSRLKPGQIIFLGTPLLRSTPAFRPARLLIASLLTALVTLVVTLSLAGVIVLPIMLFWQQLRDEALNIFLGLLLSYPLILLLSNIFGIARIILDGAWWFLFLPFRFVRKRWRGQVYGPQSRDLERTLGGRRLLALESPEDEAGLALLVSAAPRRYFAEKIRSGLSEYLDFALFDYTIDIPEVLLEKWVLGVGWLQVFFANFEVSDENDRWAYPKSIIDREDVTDDLRHVPKYEAVRDQESAAILARYDRLLADLDAVGRALRGPASISERLATVKDYIVGQVKVRHSLYYESEAIIDRVARAIANR